MARKLKDTSEPVVDIEQIDSAAADESTQAENGAQYRSRCGGALRLARENQGLSIQDIASRLRISPKQIEAIEADNFAVLPESTIVRGFIRNYAKQLKINAQPLLDAYSVIVPSTAPYEMAVKPGANMKISSYRKPRSGKHALLALVLLLGLGIWVFYQHYIEKPSPMQPSPTDMSTTEPNTADSSPAASGVAVPIALPEAALPVAERAAEESAAVPQAMLSANNPTPATANNAAIANTKVSGAPVPTTQLPGSQLTTTTTLNTAPADAAEPQPLPVSKGMAKLEFNASQETWVNVVDANGKEIYRKIIFAGSRESIDVNPPVNVTVGNAGGTSMSMNGKSIELAPHSRNNVAHIRLDN